MPQLISYIAPGAPATRRPATGDEAFLRPEIGFTPRWYREAVGVDFGERWHTDPGYRLSGLKAMGEELRRRFPGCNIGRSEEPGYPSDLLTGTFGALVVAGIWGLPLRYDAGNWPAAEHQYLTDEQADALEPPSFEGNPFWQALMAQVEWIASYVGRAEGFLNWQGVLNSAYRLRGQEILLDMAVAPERARRIFACVAETMAEGARRLHARQRESGVEVGFFTVSNCLVNLVSAGHYREFLLPHDQRLARNFGLVGVHNCAWTVDPYLEAYAEIPNVGYLDMGLESDLGRARALFPDARRAVMYPPADVASKDPVQIRADLERIARDLGPADLVCADIEAGTPDERVLAIVEACREISGR